MSSTVGGEASGQGFRGEASGQGFRGEGNGVVSRHGWIPWIGAAEALAWDEILLDEVEQGGEECLWFWESPTPFVVVGYGQSVAREVDVEAVEADAVPVLRRCSGGGTVVQGPGCLSYGLVLRMDRSPDLATVTGTNRWVMERQRRAVQSVVDGAVTVDGTTDLVWKGRKVSGNAQRRRREALLFHGTLLHGMPLDWMERWLRHPSAEPAYRGRRRHGAFVTHLPVTRDRLVEALVREWTGSVESGGHGLPTLAVDAARSARMTALCGERYGNGEWNRRR